MKLVDIIRDANSNLLRSKARTALTVIAIFIGALTLTITNGIGSGISKYIDRQLGNLGSNDVLIIQSKENQSFGTGPKKYDPAKASSSAFGGLGPSLALLQESDMDAIRSVSGVKSAEPFLSASPDYVVGPNDEKYQLSISPVIPGMNLAVEAGKAPDNGSSKNELALPFDFTSALGFESPEAAVGEIVTIGITSAAGEKHDVKVSVTGVQEQTLVSMGGASVNDALIRKLNSLQKEGLPKGAPDGHVAVIAKVVQNMSQKDLQTVKDSLDKKGYLAQTVQDRIGLFKQVIGAIIAVLNAFAVIALLAAGFGIVNTLLMAVQERTKEIGLMKAMGLSGRKIFLLFSIEAVLLGFWGSLLGSLAGIGIGFVANYFASSTFLKDLPGFNLTAFSPLSVLVIMAIIMTIAFIAGTMPARRASRKDPIDALRYE